MAINSLSLTLEEVNAITERKLLPKLQDAISKGSPLLDKLMKGAVKEGGGTHIQVPVAYAFGTGGWYSGSDTIDNTIPANIAAATFEWKGAYESVTILRTDELKNNGKEGAVRLLKAKMQMAEKSIKERFMNGLYNAGSDAKAILGTRCFLSASNTYGGIAQGTYSWWQAGSIDSTSTVFSLPALQTIWSTIALNGESPNLIVSDRANYDRLWGSLQPQQRFMSSEDADAGFMSLNFNGASFVVDSHAPSNYVQFLNTEYLKLYLHQDENFRFDPFVQLTSQNAKVGHIYTMAALICTNPRMQGAATAMAA